MQAVGGRSQVRGSGLYKSGTLCSLPTVQSRDSPIQESRPQKGEPATGDSAGPLGCLAGERMGALDAAVSGKGGESRKGPGKHKACLLNGRGKLYPENRMGDAGSVKQKGIFVRFEARLNFAVSSGRIRPGRPSPGSFPFFRQ